MYAQNGQSKAGARCRLFDFVWSFDYNTGYFLELGDARQRRLRTCLNLHISCRSAELVGEIFVSAFRTLVSRLFANTVSLNSEQQTR